jgi:type VI protein secretion system component VasK
MRLEDIAGLAFDHIFRRIFLRAFIAFAVAAFGIVAIYYFTIAGTIALEAQYGEIHARLIVGAIYAAVAVACAILWAVRGRRASSSAPALSTQRDMQITMLVEAVMLGYALARKSSRAS